MVSPGRRERGRRPGASGTSTQTSRAPPLLVERQLAAADVGGEVHLQHDVRQALGHLHGGAGGPVPPRMDVDGLVGLHDAGALAVGAAQQQVRGAEGGYRGAAHGGDEGDEGRQPSGRPLVVGGGGFGDVGGLAPGVPELDAPLVAADLAAADAHRAAAGEVLVGDVRPAAGRAGACAGAVPARCAAPLGASRGLAPAAWRAGVAFGDGRRHRDLSDCEGYSVDPTRFFSYTAVRPRRCPLRPASRCHERGVRPNGRSFPKLPTALPAASLGHRAGGSPRLRLVPPLGEQPVGHRQPLVDRHGRHGHKLFDIV